MCELSLARLGEALADILCFSTKCSRRLNKFKHVLQQ